MSKERDLLRRVVNSNWQIGTITVKLHKEIEKLLAQPDQEPFNQDWVSYRQRLAFHAGIRWAKAQHKIGVSNE